MSNTGTERVVSFRVEVDHYIYILSMAAKHQMTISEWCKANLLGDFIREKTIQEAEKLQEKLEAIESMPAQSIPPHFADNVKKPKRKKRKYVLLHHLSKKDIWQEISAINSARRLEGKKKIFTMTDVDVLRPGRELIDDSREYKIIKPKEYTGVELYQLQEVE